jgi:hypothetical protein
MGRRKEGGMKDEELIKGSAVGDQSSVASRQLSAIAVIFQCATVQFASNNQQLFLNVQRATQPTTSLAFCLLLLPFTFLLPWL